MTRGFRGTRLGAATDEGADVGEDDDTPVSEDYSAGIKSRFSGKIEKVTLEVK